MTESRFTNPSDEEIRAFLESVRRIAVVGLSPKHHRPSYGVAKGLIARGFEIVPVRPDGEEILGQTVYHDLADVPGPVDLVDVFLNPKRVGPVVDRCIELNMPAVWLQEGVIDAEAAERARDAGLFVVMDRCVGRIANRMDLYAATG